MAFENVDLFDAVANASLEKYGWQDRCEAKLIVLSENATYMVKNKETGEKEGVLRIGIVGQVKAGKSSFINALLFDGNDILPKASTPMTAALTVIKYSEKLLTASKEK